MRRSSRSSASRSRRPDPRRGRNPSNTYRPVGSPDATSAATAADGPGTTSTSKPAADGPHQPLAGVGDAGRAGVGHDDDALAARAAARARRRSATPRCGRRPAPAARRAGARCRPATAGGRCAACPRSRCSPPSPAPPRRAATDRRGCRWASPPARAAPLYSLELEHVAGLELPRREGTGLGFEHGVGLEHRTAEPPRSHRHDAQHAQVLVEERDVDGEAHAERVHPAGRAEKSAPVVTVTAEQALEPRPERRRHLRRSQHLPIAQEPGHRQVLWRISRTSPSCTS